MFSMDASLESLVSFFPLGNLVHRLVKADLCDLFFDDSSLSLSLSLSFCLSLSLSLALFLFLSLSLSVALGFGQYSHTLGLSIHRVVGIHLEPLWNPMKNYLSCQSSTKCGVLTS